MVSILINIPALINAHCLFSKKIVKYSLIESCLFLWMRWLLDMKSTLNGMNSPLTSNFFPIRADHQKLLGMLRRETK